MAESSSERADEAPCIAVPPVIMTLVLAALDGAGEEERELLAELFRDFAFRSEIKVPAAEGGWRCEAAEFAPVFAPPFLAPLAAPSVSCGVWVASGVVEMGWDCV